MGSREKDLKRSFKLALNLLLTTFSKQDFCNAFPNFTQAEQDRMHRLYIQVIVSVHQNIEDEFERLCEETKLGSVLETVEELVEEQTLDPLHPEKTNVKDVAQALSTSKKNEIKNLTAILEKSEEQKKVLRNRVEHLRKEIQGLSSASNTLGKAKTGVLKTVTSNQA
uniref:uncharacterized protein LOC122579788 n=1 Tax=Erigeron canadensis TaxID=72917 RepID=UPI001CB9967D|nr:uncharacterized protein LOC122579788 [Erigeron canadensis]